MKIKSGDKLPNSELFYLSENNEIKKIDIINLCKNNKAIILGMPGAFTKTCSALHLPGYINNYELALKKGITKIICIAVNNTYNLIRHIRHGVIKNLTYKSLFVSGLFFN